MVGGDRVGCAVGGRHVLHGASLHPARGVGSRRSDDRGDTLAFVTTVLLAEDDPAIAEPLSRALEREGYSVEVQGDGVGALERVRVGHVDLLVLDLGLPGMDGLEVCRRLRPDFPDLPVLMLTARTDEVDFVVGLDAGADDYVSKPFRLAELLARVRALLRRLTPETVDVGGVRMELSGRRVLVDGTEVSLANKEFELLRVLHAARRAGRHPRGDPARGVERPRDEDAARPSTCTCPGCAARSVASGGSRRCAASASASTTTTDTVAGAPPHPPVDAAGRHDHRAGARGPARHHHVAADGGLQPGRPARPARTGRVPARRARLVRHRRPGRAGAGRPLRRAADAGGGRPAGPVPRRGRRVRPDRRDAAGLAGCVDHAGRAAHGAAHRAGAGDAGRGAAHRAVGRDGCRGRHRDRPAAGRAAAGRRRPRRPARRR